MLVRARRRRGHAPHAPESVGGQDWLRTRGRKPAARDSVRALCRVAVGSRADDAWNMPGSAPCSAAPRPTSRASPRSEFRRTAGTAWPHLVALCGRIASVGPSGGLARRRCRTSCPHSLPCRPPCEHESRPDVGRTGHQLYLRTGTPATNSPRRSGSKPSRRSMGLGAPQPWRLPPVGRSCRSTASCTLPRVAILAALEHELIAPERPEGRPHANRAGRRARPSLERIEARVAIPCVRLDRPRAGCEPATAPWAPACHGQPSRESLWHLNLRSPECWTCSHCADGGRLIAHR